MMDPITGFRWQDGLDIFLLAVVLYSGMNLIRGTRAVPMLIGLGMVYGIYFLSGQLEIYTIHVLLQNLLGWSLVLVFIVFQNDIRRALTQVGTGPALLAARARGAEPGCRGAGEGGHRRSRRAGSARSSSSRTRSASTSTSTSAPVSTRRCRRSW
jgi:hypothetical protein